MNQLIWPYKYVKYQYMNVFLNCTFCGQMKTSGWAVDVGLQRMELPIGHTHTELNN